MTSQLICLKIDVKGQRRDVKVHNRDKLFCQFVHSLLMKICLNHEGTRIQQNVVTKGIGLPLLKKIVVLLLVCQLCLKQEMARIWPHTQSANNKN